METKKFLIDVILPVSNRNENHEDFPGGGGRCVGLTIFPTSSAEPQTPGALIACPSCNLIA